MADVTACAMTLQCSRAHTTLEQAGTASQAGQS